MFWMILIGSTAVMVLLGFVYKQSKAMEAFERIEKDIREDAQASLRRILLLNFVTLVLTMGVSLHCGFEHLPSEAICIETLYFSYILSSHVVATFWDLLQILPALVLLIMYLPRVHRQLSAALANASREAKVKYQRRTKFDKDPVQGNELIVRFTHRKRETIKAKNNVKSVVKDGQTPLYDDDEEIKPTKGGEFELIATGGYGQEWD